VTRINYKFANCAVSVTNVYVILFCQGLIVIKCSCMDISDQPNITYVTKMLSYHVQFLKCCGLSL